MFCSTSGRTIIPLLCTPHPVKDVVRGGGAGVYKILFAACVLETHENDEQKLELPRTRR